MLIFNTLSKKKEAFVPANSPRVTLYVCGPTTYNYIHLGNARPIVVFDVVRRYLRYKGFEVTYVQNFTDIDDKIIFKAKAQGIDSARIADQYIQAYFEDAGALGVQPADVYPRVTEHMTVIMDLIGGLLDKGYAYESNGDVYFDVRRFPTYGQLSGRSLAEMQVGARVEVNEQKRDPLDFVLWKKAKEGEPAWDSPWGQGRPGWHIECSAMATHYLGNGFDIHGGGSDLIFPHHENEIAQAEAFSGEKFARYFMHNGFITMDQEKMSKSLGNIFLVREVIRDFSPETLRLFLLGTHYRSPLDYSRERLEEAGRSLNRVRNTWLKLNEGKVGDEETGRVEELAARLQVQFASAMDDDFNTSLALGEIFSFCRSLNNFWHEGWLPGRREVDKARETFWKLGQEVLGILGGDGQAPTAGLVGKLVDILVGMRQEARKQKNWLVADGIRKQLAELGIVIEDTSEGPSWRWKGKEV